MNIPHLITAGCVLLVFLWLLQSIYKWHNNIRRLWIRFCVIWITVLALAPLVHPTARWILWDSERIGIEHAYIKGNFSNDAHGSGQAVFQIETDPNWNVTFDKLNSTLFWECMPPESGKLQVIPSFTAGTITLKITQDSFEIQKTPVTSGEETILDVSSWDPDAEIIVWMVVTDGENGDITVKPIK